LKSTRRTNELQKAAEPCRSVSADYTRKTAPQLR
jgi:hypothetical protein